MSVQGKIVPGRWDGKTHAHNAGCNPEWHWLGCGVKYLLIWTPNSGAQAYGKLDTNAEAINQLNHLTTAKLGV